MLIKGAVLQTRHGEPKVPSRKHRERNRGFVGALLASDSERLDNISGCWCPRKIVEVNVIDASKTRWAKIARKTSSRISFIRLRLDSLRQRLQRGRLTI